MIISTAETIRNNPKTTIPNKEKYSPFRYLSNSPDSRLTIDTRIVASITINLKKVENGSKTMASVNRVVVRVYCIQIAPATATRPVIKTQPTFPEFDLSISRSYMIARIITPVRINSG